MKPTTEQQQLARQVADAMLASDQHSQQLGISILCAELGRSVCQLRLTEQHANGHGFCHGGVIFSLADTTFAHACNARNAVNVGQACQISYLHPASIGDTLTATAVERGVHGRTGIYDITVCNEAGKVIAEFRGHSRTLPEQHVIPPNNLMTKPYTQ